MPFKGTNMWAWNKASKGRSKKQKSEIYYREKAKDENKNTHASLFFGDKTFKSTSGSIDTLSAKKRRSLSQKNSLHNKPKFQKYSYNRIVLDNLRDYRSSKIVSAVSN